MSYQPKSYNKFLAGAATAAVVASAVVPVATHAAEKNLTDVKEGSYYAEAVNALAEAGVIKGYEDGTFRPNNQVTRAEVAKIIAVQLGLDTENAGTANYSDAKGHWANTGGYLAAVAKAGIMKGDGNGTFRPNAPLTRAEMASIVVRAYDLQAKEGFESQFKDLNAGGAWAADAIKTLEANGYANGIAKGQFGSASNVKRADVAVFLFRVAKGEAAPTVESVSAINNIEVNEGAETVNLPKEVEVALSNGEKAQKAVEWDKKGLDLNKPGEYTLTGDVADTDLTASVKVVVKAVDPEVTSVNALNSKQIKVTFNKEVEKVSAEKIANYKVSTTSAFGINAVATNWKAELQADKKTVILTNSGSNAALKAETTYFFKTSDITDTKGHDISNEVKQFTTGKTTDDVVSPEVVGTKIVGSNLEITFSEPLAAEPTVVRVNDSKATATFVEGDNTKVLVNVASLKEDEVNSLYVAGAKDASGNDLKAYNGTFTKSGDNVKPFVKEIKQLSDDTAAIYFNEDLSNELKTGEVTFIKVDGTVVSKSTVEAVKTDADGNKYYEVELPAYETGKDTQTLQVLLAAGVVADTTGNANDAYSTTLTFSKDKVAPTLVSQKLVKNANGKATGVELTFSKDVTIDKSKVRVLKDNVELVASGLTTKNTTAAKKQTIAFGTGTTLPVGSYTVVFGEGAVVDASPSSNKAEAFSVNVTIDSATVAPTINVGTSSTKSVETANTIEVHYNQAMDLASITNLGNYKLDGVALDSSKANPIYVTYSGVNPIAHIELKDGWNNFGNLSEETANSILTVSGTKASTGTVIADTNIGILLHDNSAATLTSAVKSANSVILTFDQALDSKKLDNTDFVIKDADGKVITGTVSSVKLVSGNNKQIQMDFKSVPTGSYTLETAGTVDLTDINGLTVKAGVKVSVN